MKQSVTRKLVLLAAIGFLGLGLQTGCADRTAVAARHQAEKMIFEAEQAARRFAVQPDRANLTEGLYQQYDSVLQFCYASMTAHPAERFPVEYRELSGISFRAVARMFQLNFGTRQYGRASAILAELLERAILRGPAHVTAQINLGRSIQSEGYWDSALVIYDLALNSYYPPIDEHDRLMVNLYSLPLHIHDVYQTVNDPVGAAAQIPRAEQYYRRLIADYPGTQLSGVGYLSLASLYERVGRWPEAIEQLSKLIDTSGHEATSARLQIASIHANQLRQPELALDQYDRILAELEGRDTLRRPNIMYNRGLVQLYQERYTEARQTLVEVKRDYPRYFQETATVQFAIARTFELQDNWRRAEDEYKFLINNFPRSEQALSTYLFLVDQYLERGWESEAERMETKAREQYDALVATQPESEAAAAALSYKAELLRRQGRYQEAIDILTDVFDRFSTTSLGFRDMLTAAQIYRQNLSNSEAADSLIQVLKRRLTTIDETPEF